MFLSNSSQINTTLPTEDWTSVSSHSCMICLFILVNNVFNLSFQREQPTLRYRIVVLARILLVCRKFFLTFVII